MGTKATVSTESGGRVLVQADPNRQYLEVTILGTAAEIAGGARSSVVWLTSDANAEEYSGLYMPSGRTRWFTGVSARKQWRAYSSTSAVFVSIETVRP